MTPGSDDMRGSHPCAACGMTSCVEGGWVRCPRAPTPPLQLAAKCPCPVPAERSLAQSLAPSCPLPCRMRASSAHARLLTLMTGAFGSPLEPRPTTWGTKAGSGVGVAQDGWGGAGGAVLVGRSAPSMRPEHTPGKGDAHCCCGSLGVLQDPTPRLRQRRVPCVRHRCPLSPVTTTNLEPRSSKP